MVAVAVLEFVPAAISIRLQLEPSDVFHQAEFGKTEGDSPM